MSALMGRSVLEVLAPEEAELEVIAAAQAWLADNVSWTARLRTAVLKLNALNAADAQRIAADRKLQDPG